MSLASIATNLYTIQSKKNVPFKTAFSMMVREDMAMRFSVYNLVRIVTKSEFLATVAQTAYGKRTPMQRMQDEEERKQAEREKRFKVYTQVTFARINNRLNLLTNIVERNHKLISNLYTELGYFRGQRRMAVNAGTITATRIPLVSKTVKGRLDQLQDEIQSLKKLQKKKPAGKPIGSKAKKKPTKQEAEQGLSILLANPQLLAILAGSAAGLGTLAAIGTSIVNFPGVISRTTSRLSGQPGSENDDAEALLKAGDPVLAAISTGSLIGGTMAGASFLKNKFGKKESAIQTINRLTKSYREKTPNLSYREAQKKAGETASRYSQTSKQLKKWKYLSGALSGLGKLAPALAAADIAFEISRMSGYVADHSTGRMTDKEFEDNMTTSYAQLISTAGIGGITTVAGGLVGTAMFPGLGTFGGVVAGGALGAILSMAIDEENNDTLRSIANKVYKMLHDDESQARESKPSVREQVARGAMYQDGKSKKTSFIDSVKEFMGMSTGTGTPAAPTGPKDGPLSVRNNNPGNLRYDKNFTGPGGVLEGALPAEKGSYAIFPTPELGIEGMRRQVVLDTQKRKKTLREFISKYAPKEDKNDTEGYISFVSKETGVPPDGLVPLDRLRQLMYYMIQMEGGQAAVAYFKPYLTISSQGTNTRETVSVPPSTPPPTVAAAPNQSVRSPAEIPVVDAVNTQAQESQIAEVNAQAGLIASDMINRKLNAGLKAMGDKIMDVERQVSPLSPFVTNPDPSILSYRS
jgi:hypothetical protein